jgi:hypothetical protein
MVTKLKVTAGASIVELTASAPVKFRVTPEVGKVDPELITNPPVILKVGLAATVKEEEAEFVILRAAKVLELVAVIVPLLSRVALPAQAVMFVAVIVPLFVKVPLFM